MIRNFLTRKTETVDNMHEGLGSIKEQKLFEPSDFKGAWDFAVRLVMPPKTSIGLHRHGDNEEMYIILSGEGLMTLEDKERRVSQGDMILNQPGGQHGLLNDTDSELELLVIQASKKPAS